VRTCCVSSFRLVCFALDPGEELYDDGDAGGAAPTVEEDLQEVYEEFDDGTPITA